MGVSLLGPRVTLMVDNLRKSQSLVSRLGDYTLGNNTINSYVYIGGLPPWSVTSRDSNGISELTLMQLILPYKISCFGVV